MSEQEMYNQERQLVEAIAERSAGCERGIVAVREDGRAGVVLVAPNCLLFAWNFMAEPVPGCFFDLYLN